MRALFILTLVTFTLTGCNRSTSAPSPGVISDDFVFGLNRVEHAYGDTDHDDTPELFLGNASTAGNAGMNFLVLQRKGRSWRPMGEIFLHPGAFRILPLASNGTIRLLRCWHMGGGEGRVDTLTYRDGAFVMLSSETIYTGDGTDEDRKRYEDLFSDHSPGRPLRSSMSGSGNP